MPNTAQRTESNHLIPGQMKKHLALPFLADNHGRQLKIPSEFHIPCFTRSFQTSD
jgi:hypothetical protein